MESFIIYSEAVKQIPPATLEHLKMLIRESGFGENDEVYRKMVEAWLLKKASFAKMAEHSGFTARERFEKEDTSGCCLLTRSGSLIFLGPLVSGRRDLSYTSIGFRTDVPQTYSESGVALAGDIECGKPVIISGGKMERTSIITDIAVRPQLEPADVQAEELKKAESRIKLEFINHNRQILTERTDNKSLRSRDDLFRKWIILEWFQLGGLEMHIFTARARILWLELFSRVYESLTRSHRDAAERDRIFLEFSNSKFAGFCDDYKWYESEKKDFDIGLMKALEELPEYKQYIDFSDKYINTLK